MIKLFGSISFIGCYRIRTLFYSSFFKNVKPIRELHSAKFLYKIFNLLQKIIIQ